MDYKTMTVEELEQRKTELSQQRDALLEQQNEITTELEVRALTKTLTPEAVELLKARL